MERLRRQRLQEPAKTEEEYAALFRLLQPVTPDMCPGSPPILIHRTTFDDMAVASKWRETRKIVKGRFLRGSLGYVFSDELELYANAFQKPLARLSEDQQFILDTLLHVGPLAPRQIKQETGMLIKELMPILHRLQQAFLVYEDQVDSDWERAWYVFEREWPDVIVEPERWEAAAREVLLRFIQSQAFVTSEQIKDWSGWAARDIKYLLQRLQDEGSVVSCSVDGLGEGWMRMEDASIDAPESSPTVFMLQGGDPVVRACTSELKRRFAGLEVLQYLLIDGDFRGAVCGHWRIGPHDVDDIVLELTEDECEVRKDAILSAVASCYKQPRHSILRYNGCAL